MVILRERQETKKEAFAEKMAVREYGVREKEDNFCIRQVRKLGFAVDIGTTTVVVAGFAFLKEDAFFNNGNEKDGGGSAAGSGRASVICIGKKSALNAQAELGKDVMMRIMHALSGKQEKLRKLVVEQVETLACSILEEAGLLEETEIKKMETEFVVVGNTTMCHLFLGADVNGLKGAPFQMAYHGNQTLSGKETGCSFFKEAAFFILSGIAAHVGADALSVFCETGMKQEDKVLLAVDLGTNAEILLSKKGELWCCSAAAGPAFEGRGISAGRTSGKGVISGVKMAAHTGNMILEYPAGEPVGGICGSGLIDLLAGLRSIGLISEDGYLFTKAEAEKKKSLLKWLDYLEQGEQGEHAFLIYGGEKKLYLTQEDIRNLQLAKGAIGAAVSVLLHENGLKTENIDGLFLAGVLGSSIRIKNAMQIGLIPEMETKKVIPVGNAALDGAVRLLLRPELRKEWEETAKEVTHLELAGRKDFSSFFMKFLGMDSKFS